MSIDIEKLKEFAQYIRSMGDIFNIPHIPTQIANDVYTNLIIAAQELEIVTNQRDTLLKELKSIENALDLIIAIQTKRKKASVQEEQLPENLSNTLKAIERFYAPD